jgi:hypothetical protein
MRTAVIAADEAVDARAAWSLRVRRVGGFIQAGFAAFWLIRGGLALGGSAGPILAAVLGVAAIAAFGYGIRATAGTAPRPKGAAAHRIERAITVATIIQLVASFVAPALVIAVGQPEWVLPSIAITIGPLLLWLDQRVGIPRLRPVGATLIIGPVLLAATLSGTVLVVTTGITAGALLLVTAVAGFRDLSDGNASSGRLGRRRAAGVSACGASEGVAPGMRGAARIRSVPTPAAPDRGSR